MLKWIDSLLEKLLGFVASNRLFRKVAEKVLLTHYIRRVFEKISRFYAVVRFEEGLDTFTGESEYLGIIGNVSIDIRENLSEGDARALGELVKKVRRDGMTIAEVGSWKGFSTSVLARSVVDCHGTVFAVDHWMGSAESENVEDAKAHDIYAIFKRNMISLGLWDIVHPLVMDSLTASQIFADGILDLVFIDADHRYEPFKKDVSAWLPKLRNGGILCGHDCEGYYSQYPEEIRKKIDNNLGEQYLNDIKCHPGVVKAVHECFPGRYSIMPNSGIWYHIKKATDSTS